MRITLAYPLDGIGAPDETVEVDETTARRLLADGYARPAAEPVPEPAEPRRRPAKARSPRKPPAGGNPAPHHEGGQ